MVLLLPLREGGESILPHCQRARVRNINMHQCEVEDNQFFVRKACACRSQGGIQMGFFLLPPFPRSVVHALLTLSLVLVCCARCACGRYCEKYDLQYMPYSIRMLTRFCARAACILLRVQRTRRRSAERTGGGGYPRSGMMISV